MLVAAHLLRDVAVLQGQATAVLVLLLTCSALLRRMSPRLRHTMLAFGLLGLLLLPLQLALPLRWIGVDPAWVPVDWAAADVASVASAPVAHSARGGEQSPATIFSLAVLVVGVLGATVFAARAVGLWVGASTLVRDSAPVDPRVARMCSRLDPRARVRVRASAGVDAPIVLGALRSTILLPVRSSSWSEAHIDAVLRHELAHVRHKDPLWLRIGDLALIFYWANPLFWLARGRLRLEAEHAADDAVLRGGVQPSTYAEVLLDLTRALPRRPRAAWATGAARPSQLRRRVVDILARRPRFRPRLRELVPIALGSLGAVLVSAVVYVDRPVEPPIAAPGETSGPAANSRTPAIVVEIPGDSRDEAARFLLHSPASDRDRQAETTRVDLPGLRIRLCAAARADATTGVNIKADAGVSHLSVVQVMDAAKQCGLLRLGILHGRA